VEKIGMRKILTFLMSFTVVYVILVSITGISRKVIEMDEIRYSVQDTINVSKDAWKGGWDRALCEMLCKILELRSCPSQKGKWDLRTLDIMERYIRDELGRKVTHNSNKTQGRKDGNSNN
jgi:hypothetical protein